MAGDEKIVCVVASAQPTGFHLSFLCTLYFTDRRIIVAKMISQLQNAGRGLAIGGGGAAAGGLLGSLIGGKTGGVVGAIVGGVAGDVEAYNTELGTQRQKIEEDIAAGADSILGRDPSNYEIPYSDIEALYTMRNPVAVLSAAMKMSFKVVTTAGKKYTFVMHPDSLLNMIRSEKVEYEEYINLLRPLLGDKLKADQWKNF